MSRRFILVRTSGGRALSSAVQTKQRYIVVS